MKVIHLISGGDVGGAKTHVLSLLASLQKTIDKAELVCFREGDFAQEARELGIPTHIVDGGFSSNLRLLKSMISEGGFDVVHCHGSRANFMAMLLKRSLKLPFVTTVHSDYKLDYLGRPAARLTYGVLNSIALRHIDYHIGVSDSMAELLISRGFAPENIYTIYNGVDCSLPLRGEGRKAFFSRFGIEAEDGWVIAGIGARLNPVKDMATLIRAFARISGECPALRLAIAGDGEQDAMLKALAQSLGVSEKVFFLGWVTDMDSFYSAIDVNCLTSLSETFPYSLTEGARYSLPAVSSRVGGVSKLILPGSTGFLFEPGDDAALAEHLKKLALDPELRKSIGAALERRLREKFSLEKTVETQEAIYKSIIRREEYSEKRCGATICGAYGQGNAGDDAILEAILGSLRAIDADMPITVLSKRPKETARSYRVKTVFTFNPPAYLKAMRRSALYINGGGSLIQNVTSRRSLWFYLSTLKAARKRGCKIMMYGCGIGPVSGKGDRAKTARYLNSYVDRITLRDARSLDELKLLGVTKPEILLSADPAITLPPEAPEIVDELMRSAGMEPDGKYIAFSVRKWTGFSSKAPAFAAAADYAFEKYGLTPVFVPVNHLSDPAAARAVTALMKRPAVVLEGPLTSGETIGLFSRMSALLSMRLHALIFAAGTGIPLAAASYDPKVDSFMEYVGQERCVPFAAADEKSLCALVDSLVSAPRGALAERAKELAELEKINPRCAAELLGI